MTALKNSLLFFLIYLRDQVTGCITLPAHDSATIVAELSFVKTYLNTIRPRLINPAIPGFVCIELAQYQAIK